jgi:Type VI secretion system (T6SS), amidase effector protein 4
MSKCLNESGAPLVHLAGLYALSGGNAATSLVGHRPGHQKPRFIVRVRDMMIYLQRVYGRGHIVYDARTEPKAIHLKGRKHVQGIIVFEWLGPPREFGATGHVDLFSIVDRGPNAAPQFVPACDGECFWLTDAGPMVAHLWETTS